MKTSDLKTVLLAALLLVANPAAHGMFMIQQLKQVPIDRVLANLQEKLRKNPNDAAAAYHLARVYSMAYATNLAVVPIETNSSNPVFSYPGALPLPSKVTPRADAGGKVAARRSLTNAIALYRQASTLVFQGTNAIAHKWLIVPIHLGLAWCLEQEGDRERAIKAYRRALQLAWQQEVDPGFDLNERAKWAWHELRAGRNPLAKPPPRGYLGPGACYSCEIIGSLLNLLDPVRDAKEIAQLRADQKTLASMSRAVTPIVVPLQDGTALADLVDERASVRFDLDGSGSERRWGWITPKAAWLVFDPEGDGRITSGLQLFGNVTFWIFWRDGYEALSSLDDNGDGVLSGAELAGLCLWHDGNGNGVSEPGEVAPVTSYGIREIRLDAKRSQSQPLQHPRGILLNDGTVRPTFDWISPSR